MNDLPETKNKTTTDSKSRASVWGDIKSPSLLYLKGGLFVVLCVMSGGAILLLHPSIRVALLLAVCVWSACRAYYFAFYVIEHYVDDGQRYAGLFDFLVKRRRKQS